MGLTQSGLAALLDYTPNAIALLERSERVLRKPVALAVEHLAHLAMEDREKKAKGPFASLPWKTVVAKEYTKDALHCYITRGSDHGSSGVPIKVFDRLARQIRAHGEWTPGAETDTGF